MAISAASATASRGRDSPIGTDARGRDRIGIAAARRPISPTPRTPSGHTSTSASRGTWIAARRPIPLDRTDREARRPRHTWRDLLEQSSHFALSRSQTGSPVHAARPGKLSRIQHRRLRTARTRSAPCGLPVAAAPSRNGDGRSRPAKAPPSARSDVALASLRPIEVDRTLRPRSSEFVKSLRNAVVRRCDCGWSAAANSARRRAALMLCRRDGPSMPASIGSAARPGRLSIGA